MNLRERLEADKPTLSFEFFPPRTPAASRSLFQTIHNLIPLKPSYVSVTYGAGGSSRGLTHDLVVQLQTRLAITIVPHLTCLNSSRREIAGLLQKYQDLRIQNVMALRGDITAGSPVTCHDFKYAGDLVAFIKKEFPNFCVGVAGYPEGHPQTPNRLREMDFLKAKVDQGADYLCTQLFFDNHHFYDFKNRCLLSGITIPITAGVMPVTSRKTLNRIAELAGGTVFPSSLLKLLHRARNDTQFEHAGIHWAAEQVRDLLDHDVRGIHFYTLNRYRRILRIYESLGISSGDDI